MKALLIKLLVALVLVLPPMAAGIPAVAATLNAHTVQHTQQVAARRPPICQPWPNCGHL